MSKPRLFLLPGLDGTATLFKRFIAAAPAHLSLTPIALPRESLNYSELSSKVVAELPDEPSVIVGESFSGAIAVAASQRRPVAGLILCNTFVFPPRSTPRWPANPIFFRLPLPSFLLRRYLVGDSADVELVREVAAAVKSVPPEVLAFRLRLILEMNEASNFARSGVPTLYVRGCDDRIVPESAYHRMADLRPMTVAQVRGPHLLLQANPVGAWQVIAPFLDSLEEPGR